MIRRLGFVVVFVSALIVAACGRQVTPDKNGTGPGGGLPAGFMQIKYRVAQQFNFGTYSYVIVFNTSGDGSTPRANGTQTAYQGYSFAIIVSGSGNNVSATAWYFYRPPGTTNQAPILEPVLYSPQDLRLTLNSNGQNTEFNIIVNRVLASAYSSPSPGATASASPSGSPSASPSPSPSPSSSASASPIPSPTSTVGNVAGTWTFNYFVVQGTLNTGNSIFASGYGTGAGLIVDSLGQGGGTDATYTSSNLDVTSAFDTGPFYPNPHPVQPPDGSSTISGGDISNNP